jgi:Tol biopolymer transport system component
MKNDSGWDQAVNINPQILSDGEFYPTGLSYNGKQLLLIKKEEENGDIYISNLEGGIWSKAFRLDNKINSLGMESFASFSHDGRSIYLSSNRSGRKGSFDIYRSKLTSKGQWGRPKNMGKIINTEFDEQNPVSCNNDHVLFFSSKGHYNIGGFDIFYCSLKDRKWSIPINIGFPVNNTRDNLLFYPTEQCRQGYYAIDDSSGFGQSDIYLIIIKAVTILNFENTADEK